MKINSLWYKWGVWKHPNTTKEEARIETVNPPFSTRPKERAGLLLCLCGYTVGGTCGRCTVEPDCERYLTTTGLTYSCYETVTLIHQTLPPNLTVKCSSFPVLAHSRLLSDPGFCCRKDNAVCPLASQAPMSTPTTQIDFKAVLVNY